MHKKEIMTFNSNQTAQDFCRDYAHHLILGMLSVSGKSVLIETAQPIADKYFNELRLVAHGYRLRSEAENAST